MINQFLHLHLRASPLLFRWLIAALLFVPYTVTAQPFYFGNENPRESTAIFATYAMVDFSFDGDTTPRVPLDFNGPTYGLALSRSNLFASFGWGRETTSDTSQTDLSLLDFSLAAWAEVFFSPEAKTADNKIFAPIMVFTNYRRVTPDEGGTLEEFNITTLGLGLGLGYHGKLSEKALLEIRSVPGLGFSSQSFGESSGLARLIDTDIQMHFGSIFNRVGISIRYAYRIQIWDIRATSILGNLSRDLYDYRDSRHSFSLGVNW